MNAKRYQQQLIKLNIALLEKRPEWDKRHEECIFLHGYVPCHRAKIVSKTLKELKWEVLSHPPYSPDLAPSDYHLFRSMAHDLAGQHLTDFDNVTEWLSEWFQSKDSLLTDFS